MQNQSTTAYEQSLKGTETTNFQVSQPSNENTKNITDLYKQDSISSNEHININHRTHSKMDQYNLLNNEQHEDLQHKEIRVFMKKAQKLNEVSYRKLHEGKVLMPEPSVLNIYKSSKNIFDDIAIPVNRDKQIRSIYLQGAKNQKRSVNIPKKTKSLLKRKLTTDSKLVQTETLNVQVNEASNTIPSQRAVNRTLDAKPKIRKTLKAIQQDEDEQFIPVKRKNVNNRMFNTISLTGDIIRNKVDSDRYLNNVVKAEHQFNRTVRRYSVKQQYQQSTVFNNTYNGFNNGSFLQPIVNQAAVNHWQSSTIQKAKPKQEESLPIIKQKSSLQQQTKKYTQQNNNNQTQASRMLKTNPKTKQITQNSMFVENDNSYRKSRKGTQAQFTIMRNTFSNNFNSDLKQQQSSYYPSVMQSTDRKQQKNNNKVETSIQVPQIYEIAIGTDTNNFVKLPKKIIHPINIGFTQDQSNWILSDYKPKSQYIRNIDTKNFSIKKYRNGVYFGELNQNGMKNGSGVVFYFNGRSYQGNFVNDLKSGKGFQYMPDGSSYKGQFRDGLKDGKGTFQWANGEIYDGQWVGGKKNGSGMWKSPKGDTYLGQWKNGKIQGFGVLTIKEGDRYQGQFKNSMKNGLGTQRYSNGDTYVGQFAKNRPNGQGQYYFNNGDVYRGMFSNGLKHGQGYLKNSNGQIYQGEFRNEKKCGLGQQINADGSKYKGNFQNNMKHGYGEEVTVDGTFRKGYWINDNMVDTDMDPIIQDQLDRQQSIANIKGKQKRQQQGEQGSRKNQLKVKAQKRRSPLSKSPQFSKQKSLSPSDPNFNRACGCKRKH